MGTTRRCSLHQVTKLPAAKKYLEITSKMCLMDTCRVLAEHRRTGPTITPRQPSHFFSRSLKLGVPISLKIAHEPIPWMKATEAGHPTSQSMPSSMRLLVVREYARNESGPNACCSAALVLSKSELRSPIRTDQAVRLASKERSVMKVRPPPGGPMADTMTTSMMLNLRPSALPVRSSTE